MTRYAVVVKGEVIDVMEAADGYTYPDRDAVLVPSEDASPGWRFDGTQLIAPAPPPPPPPPTPQSITRRQLRLWLVRHGIALEAVEAAIATLPQGQRTEAIIEWMDATQYERDNPLLVQLAGAVLGLQGAKLDAALDAVFAEAARY